MRPKPDGEANRLEIQTNDGPSRPKAVAVEPGNANVQRKPKSRPPEIPLVWGRSALDPIPAFDGMNEVHPLPASSQLYSKTPEFNVHLNHRNI